MSYIFSCCHTTLHYQHSVLLLLTHNPAIRPHQACKHGEVSRGPRVRLHIDAPLLLAETKRGQAALLT